MSVKKKVGIGLGIIAAVLTVAYIGLSVFFQSHFYFGSTINGVDVAGISKEEAKNKMQAALDDYELVIEERDGTTESIIGSEIGMTVDWEDSINGFMESQNGFEWIIKLFQPDSHEIAMDISFQEASFLERIENLNCLGTKQIEPQNAQISEYSTEKGYELIPSVAGSTIKKEVLVSVLEECIRGFETTVNLDEKSCYVEPDIKDDNEQLLAAIAQLNQALGTVVTYQIGASTEVLDASVFQPWLRIDENYEVSLDEDEISAYVKELASAYNTCYSSKKLMTSYGKEVTIGNSHYGWKVDNATEKAAIIEEIMAGQSVTRDLHYSMTANSHEGNDYGNSYVEINLTAQELFLYVDGSLIVKSELVSGDLSDGNASPTGAFGLTYKERNATLNGEDYSTPVSYWMPFAGNVGMHDATWRSSFGGSIYKRNGSHGCINLPKSNAETIFQYISTGFPVLVYELEGTQTAKGIAQDQAYRANDLIKAIGTVTLESESAIVSARTYYDSLSESAKSYVTNYQKLLDAEAALEALKPTTIEVQQ